MSKAYAQITRKNAPTVDGMLQQGETKQKVQSAAWHQAPAGPRGASLAPPGYGIAALDRQPEQAISEAIQLESGPAAAGHQVQQPNHTGLPDKLKAGVEALSGLSLDDVRVHYNASGPAQLQALAYTQGSEIHVAPGQERYLPHEAWHVVQQKQGRVRAITQFGGVRGNDDWQLEREADLMGATAARSSPTQPPRQLMERSVRRVVQRYTDVRSVEFVHEGKVSFEFEKSRYLERFVNIQRFLSDIDRVKPHLDHLNEALIRFDSTLNQMLLLQMSDWSRELLTLVDPAPSDDFRKMGKRGVLFEDYVDLPSISGPLSHGVQSHRIQWYLISKEFGSEAVKLYKKSLDPIFDCFVNRVRKAMWDLIVDGSSEDPHDFTQPGKLHRYLVADYTPPNGQENKLGQQISDEQKVYANRRRALRELRAQLIQNRVTSPTEATPTYSETDHQGNVWSGLIRDHDRAPWKPTILQKPSSLDAEFETFKIALSAKASREIDDLEKQFNESRIGL